MNRAKPMKHLLVPALISVALTACAPDPTSDLVEYTEQVKSQQKAKIEPLPEFEPFESFEYAAFDLRDPFTVPGFSHTPASVAKIACGSGSKPDFDR